MKKQTKNILLISLGILILIGVIFLIFYATGVFQTVFFGFNEFTCSFISNEKLGCSTPGASMQGDPYAKEGYLEFKIYNVYNLYFKQFEGFKKILIANDNSFKEFFDINNAVCYFRDGNYRVLAGDNYNDRWINEIESSLRYWQSSWDDGCYGVSGGRYELHPNVIISKKFPNQLLIVKGNIKSQQYSEQNPIYTPFTTYGFCDLVTGNCKLYEPVLNDWNYQRYAEIISIEIPLKIGGYVESEVNCPEENIEKCEGNTLFKCVNYQFISQGNVEGKCGYESKKTYYRFLNNQCFQIELYEKEKTAKDYTTSSECQSRIIIKNIYYRFSNNQCSEIELLESEKTANDYLTILECSSKIVSPQKNIYYRFENNECSEISLYPDEITNNDYLSMELCSKNIIIVVGKVIYYRLKDNVCTQVQLYPEELTNSDYETIDECNSKIEIKYNLVNNKCESSLDGQYTLFECQGKIIVGDTGYIVENKVCKYTESNPKFNTLSECRESLKIIPKPNYTTYLVIGIIVLIIAGAVIILIIKKK